MLVEFEYDNGLCGNLIEMFDLEVIYCILVMFLLSLIIRKLLLCYEI